MKITYLLTILSFFTLTISCQPKSTSEVPENNTEEVELPIADNSRNAIDWAGTYSGVLPCANCAGMEMKLEIMADYSYKLSTTYLGKTSEPVLQSGTFYWNNAGSAISLGGLDDVYQFLVGENQLIKLDQEGNRIEGALAEKYVLVKIK